ncbi:unnamed protein product, partial [Rotaria sp. Silwood1]
MALGFLPAHEIKKAYQDIIKPQMKAVPATPVALRHNLRFNNKMAAQLSTHPHLYKLII